MNKNTIVLTALMAIMAATIGCIPADNDALECNSAEPATKSEVLSLLTQARQGRNQVIEVESGTGSGVQQPRANASNATTVLLMQGETRIVRATLGVAGSFELRLLYTNDGPGTTDQVTFIANGQTRMLALPDTREGYCSGLGWNNISAAGPAAPAVNLVAGENVITLTLSAADTFGAELDALLLFALDDQNTSPPPQPPTITDVSSVDQLRSAIHTAPAASTIRVAAGTYTLDRSIDIARDDLTIEGVGEDTLFVLATGTRCPAFILSEPTPANPTITRKNLTLKSMRIRGYRFANPRPEDELCSVPGREHLRNNAVTIRQATDCVVQDITVENCASGGIVLEKSCRNILLSRVVAWGHEYDGIAWDGDIQDSRIEDCTLRSNDGAGLSFDIGPANNHVEGCIICDNARVGLFIRDSQNNCFTGCTFESNGEDGVFIADGDAPDAAAVGNAFVNNGYLNNARNGIWQAGQRSRDNCEQGGTFSGNAGVAKMESFSADAPLIVCATLNPCAH